MTRLMIALLAAGALLTGCSKSEGDGKTGSTSDSVGVTECDDYIKRMESCMSKTPAAKTAMEASFKTTRDGFKTAASTPEGKTALKTSCKTMSDALAKNPMCK